MRMHTTAGLAATILVAVVLSGCGQASAPADGIKKVGLIVTAGSAIDDRSFNELAWNGVQRAAKEFNLQSDYVEPKQPGEIEGHLARMADAGYDFIVASGYPIADALAAVAAKYPRVKFAIVDHAYDPPLPNAIGLVFAEDEAGFLAGALAAQITRSNVIGGVFGQEIPPVVRFRKGYEAGAAFVDKDIKVLGVYVGSFNDAAAGAAAAQAMLAQNADVIFAAAGTTGNAALVAAKQRRAYAIGVDTDQYNTLPEAKDALVSSAMKRVDVAVYGAIKTAVQGTFKGGTQLYATANDGVALAPFHDFETTVPEAVKSKLEEIKKGLKNGSIKTNVKP
ncbi:MAG: BMP family ABC transporter substrate-binding protein [Chloroflexi bacterium]|nr:BMP family ABC transporter substrate-binding protein [Chloroflexota bacterium]